MISVAIKTCIACTLIGGVIRSDIELNDRQVLFFPTLNSSVVNCTTIEVLGDNVVEDTEDYVVTLTPTNPLDLQASGGVPLDASISIRDDDGA